MTEVHWHFEQGLEVPPSPEAWLSSVESGVLAGLRFPKRRNDWLRGRWATKRLVAPLVGLTDWRRLSILPAPDGVPEVWIDGQRAGLTVSLSHTRDDALSVVSLGQAALGCDLETIGPRSRGFEQDYFTEGELAWVARYSSDARAIATNLVWSAKESTLKALRVGFVRDARSVEVRVKAPGLNGQATNGARAPAVQTLENLSDSDETREVDKSTDRGSCWHPLSVRSRPDDQTFHGWWRREGDRVLTMVMSPRPTRPGPLDARGPHRPTSQWRNERGL